MNRDADVGGRLGETGQPLTIEMKIEWQGDRAVLVSPTDFDLNLAQSRRPSPRPICQHYSSLYLSEDTGRNLN